MSDLQPVGARLVAEDSAAFMNAMSDADNAVNEFADSAESSGSRIDAMGEIMTGALRAVGSAAVELAAAGVQAILGFATDSFQGALEADQGMARLRNTIAATGEAAGLTADEANDLAQQYKGLFGANDDLVLSVQEMALRMGTVSEEEMPQFIETVANLAAATGQDAVSAARMLGMAYEDPMAAMGRFKRMGIVFNDDLQAQIKKMVEAGDAAGAQALMMQRVNEATSGAAQTMANTASGQLAIFNETIADAGEGVMLALLPGLTTLAQAVLPTLTGWITGAADTLGGFADAISWAVGNLAGGGGFVETLQGLQDFSWDDMFGPEVAGIINVVLDAVTGFAEFVTANIPTVEAAFGSVFAHIQDFIGEFMSVLDSLQPEFEIIFGDITGTQLPSLQQIFDTVFPFVMGLIEQFINWLRGPFLDGVIVAVKWVAANWPTIQATIDSVMAEVQRIVNEVLTWIQDFWGEWGDDIMDLVDTVTSQVSDIFSAFSKAFKGDWRGFGEDLRDAWDKTWEAAKEIVTKAFAWFTEQDWGAIGSNIVKGIADGITAATGFIVEAAKAAVDAAIKALKGFLGIESPAKLPRREIGRPIGQGMALGVLDEMANVQAASMSLAQAAMSPVRAMQNVFSGGSSSVSNTRNFNLTLNTAQTSRGVRSDFGMLESLMAGV